jgi:hypothetical protein
MADDGIKKVVISQANLPKMASDGNYYLRYRIASEDKTSISAWSQIYKLIPQSLWTILGISSNPTYSFSSDGTNVGLSWNIPQALVNNTFDIFLNWGLPASTTTATGTLGTNTITVGSATGIVVGQYVSGVGIATDTTVTNTVGTTITLSNNITSNLSSSSVDFITFAGWVFDTDTTSNTYYKAIPSAYLYTPSTRKYVRIRVQTQTNPNTITDVAKFIETSMFSTKPTAIGGGGPTTASKY